ncbi:hypothetical protein [Thalassomonas sp. M1454]|uniref:hypothetical protein n=1 Tax=Thalassomonas sp. M1454 TaxID=2594477 RepID=UPI0011810458|nr:hypothetical protein [Thalassomonas sp. M1454]TRX55852.1 hypothetical protein FNN08_09550 [Thalassomonas sp. M1454]
MYHRNQLIGQWHRSEQNGAQNTNELAQMNDDGSFSFSFYTYTPDGTIIDEITELGDWGLVGDIHFTITKGEVENETHYVAEPTEADNYHAYKVLHLSAERFTYEHVVTGEKYTLFKVLTDSKQN